MKRLGISIYLNKFSVKEIKEYIDLAAKYGVSRIFTCLISIESDIDNTIKKFKEVIEHGNKCGMETILDINPEVFEKLGTSYDDLSLFKEIGATGIRLDQGFDGTKEAEISYNKEGLLLEVNASIPSLYVNNVLSFKPKRNTIISCHNFYPQRYTGLSLDLFRELNENLMDNKIKIAAFVSNNEKGKTGPWDVSENLTTLEMHRDLNLSLQMRHLFAEGIDDVIISTMPTTKEEFQVMEHIEKDKITFKIILETKLSKELEELVYDFNHVVRGDMSDYMARSTMSRIKYKDLTIKPENTRKIKKGDIVVLNDEYNRYKGELHICMRDMENEGNKNVIGRIPEDEFILLDFLKPWVAFKVSDKI